MARSIALFDYRLPSKHWTLYALRGGPTLGSLLRIPNVDGSIFFVDFSTPSHLGFSISSIEKQKESRRFEWNKTYPA